jgi:hypothetical protein
VVHGFDALSAGNDEISRATARFRLTHGIRSRLIFAAALVLVWVAATLKIVTAIIDPAGRMRAWHSSFEGGSSLLIADAPRHP